MTWLEAVTGLLEPNLGSLVSSVGPCRLRQPGHLGVLQVQLDHGTYDESEQGCNRIIVIYELSAQPV